MGRTTAGWRRARRWVEHEGRRDDDLRFGRLGEERDGVGILSQSWTGSCYCQKKEAQMKQTLAIAAEMKAEKAAKLKAAATDDGNTFQ